MQISSLGAVHQMNIGQGKQQITKAGGFATFLSGLMDMNQSAGQSQLIKEDESLSNEEMMALLQLLQVEDISELENGPEIFLELLSNPEMDKTGFIKTQLQMSDPELLASLSALMAGIRFEQSDGEFLQKGIAGVNEELLPSNQQMLSGADIEKAAFNSQNLLPQSDQGLFHAPTSDLSNLDMDQIEKGKLGENLEKLNIAFSQGNVQDAIVAFTQLLQSLNMDQVTFSPKKNVADAIHSLKILQLLSKYESPESEQKALTAFLGKAELVLNGIKKDDNALNRKEFLNQIFTPLLKEAKHDALTTRQTHLPVPVLQTAMNEEQINEIPIVKPNSTAFDTGSGFMQLQQMTKNEQLVWMLEKSGQPVSSEQLIAQFEKILANSQMIKTGNTQRMFIKLNPEHLGLLKIELMKQDTAIIAKITAASSQAKDLLESQVQNLKIAFGSQNIQLDKIEITMQPDQQERFLNKDSQQGNKDQQENRKQNEQQPEEFSLSFAEALISTEV